MTYTELQAQIIDWSHRSDLAAKVPDFIALAENILLRELSLHAIETSVTGTTSGETLPFPADASSIESVELEGNGVTYTLTYTSPNGVELLTIGTDIPSRFTVQDGDIRLISAPDGPYTYTIFYIPKLAPLSDIAPSNWLSINHADAYLSGGMAQVGLYTKDPVMVGQYQPMFLAAIDSITRADQRQRFPTAGGLQIKPRNAR